MPQSAEVKEVARALMRRSGPAALATLGADGVPFASYVLVAPADDGSPILLLSKLAMHSKNIARDPRASLLVVGDASTNPDPMTVARITLTGRVLNDPSDEAKQRFLARHADAKVFAAFGDFSFYRMHIEAGHLVAGFGRISSLTGTDLLGREDGK